MDSERPKKRRKYSKNGCLSCKKAKVKCDEKMPICTRCQKLSIDCEYLRTVKFKPCNVEPQEPKKPVTVTVEQKDHQTPRPDFRRETEQFVNLLANQELLVGDVLAADGRYNNAQNNNNLHLLTTATNDARFLDIPKLPDLDLQDFADLFASEAARIEDEHVIKAYDFVSNLTSTYSDTKGDKFCKELQLTDAETVHFQSFIKNVHLILYPFAETYMDSPFVRIFLEKARTSRYLLNAMLASGARYLLDKARADRDLLVSVQTHNHNPSPALEGLKAQIEIHEKSMTHYLSNCFHFLHAALEKPDNVGVEAESALLTSLILTSDLSSYHDNRWSVHLKGAQQFLKEYAGSPAFTTRPVIVAKYMFSSLEISAWMFCSTAVNMLDIRTIDQWLPLPLNHAPVKELLKLGMAYDGYRENKDGEVECVIGGYKPYLGYSDDTAALLRQIILTIVGKDHPSPANLCKIFALIDNAERFYVITNKPPFRIPIDNKFHPLYDGCDKTKAPLGCYCYTGKDGVSPWDSWYSYFDLCNKVRIDALHLYTMVGKDFMNIGIHNPVVRKLLTESLKDVGFLVWFIRMTPFDEEVLKQHYDSDIIITDMVGVTQLNLQDGTFEMSDKRVSGLVDDYLSETLSGKVDYSRYLQSQIDHRICMVQWCVMIFGYCSTIAKEKILIERLLTRVLQVGVRSGRFTLEKLAKIWTQRRIRYRDPTGRLFRLNPKYETEFFEDQGTGFLYS